MIGFLVGPWRYYRFIDTSTPVSLLYGYHYRMRSNGGYSVHAEDQHYNVFGRAVFVRKTWIIRYAPTSRFAAEHTSSRRQPYRALPTYANAACVSRTDARQERLSEYKQSP